MTTLHLPNNLRVHRKRLGLLQDEVAYLLGVKSGAQASRYERRSRIPDLETILAFEVIFGCPLSELFDGHTREVRKRVAGRARKLQRKLANHPDAAFTERRKQALEAIIHRYQTIIA